MSSRIFVVLALILRFNSLLELIFVYSIRKRFNFIVFMWMYSCPSSVSWKDSSPPFYCLGTLSKSIELKMYKFIFNNFIKSITFNDLFYFYFYFINFIPLICMSALLPVSHCLYYSISVVSFEIGTCKSSYFVVLFQDCLDYTGSFAISYEFRVPLIKFCNQPAWIYIHFVDFLDPFGGYCHLKNCLFVHKNGCLHLFRFLKFQLCFIIFRVQILYFFCLHLFLCILFFLLLFWMELISSVLIVHCYWEEIYWFLYIDLVPCNIINSFISCNSFFSGFLRMFYI